jgi:hypothetical protein
MKEYGAEKLSRLAVLWTTADLEVTKNMVFMYTKNAKKKGWFDVVRLIVWGPSARELAETTELQALVTEMLSLGVEVAACKACAERYDKVEALEALGIEMLYIGEPFSDMIKSGWKVLAV